MKNNVLQKLVLHQKCKDDFNNQKSITSLRKKRKIIQTESSSRETAFDKIP